MKNIKNINLKASALTLLLIALFANPLFMSCKKDESGGSMPVVNYVRITNPDKSDSLVTHAFLGNTIAIVGEDLENVREVWFNDQSAYLNLSLITNNCIIVTIPDEIPGAVTGKMLLINGDKKDTLKYDFGVDVPAPRLDDMVCEYVKDGGTAVIEGNFFINDPSSPLKVFFPGNIEGTVTSVTLTKIKVTVPSGVGVGPISVKSIYGSSRSAFYFRDDRNIVLDFDVLTAAGGWRSGVLADSDPDPISGKFVRFSGNMAAGIGATWDEDHFSFNLWPSSNGRADVPLYSGDLASAAIKFECNVTAAWQASALQMIFTPYSTFNTNSYIGDASVPRGLWNPWKATGKYVTDGWTTVTVPLSEFKYAADGSVCANVLTKDMLRGLTFFVFNGGVKGTDCTPNICIDNIRIVPYK
jgi:hypothetical protein